MRAAKRMRCSCSLGMSTTIRKPTANRWVEPSPESDNCLSAPAISAALPCISDGCLDLRSKSWRTRSARRIAGSSATCTARSARKKHSVTKWNFDDAASTVSDGGARGGSALEAKAPLAASVEGSVLVAASPSKESLIAAASSSASCTSSSSIPKPSALAEAPTSRPLVCRSEGSHGSLSCGLATAARRLSRSSQPVSSRA
mmetsp:Transcript_40184/g.93785  ORF Transcript_40184/g.93785 Transcript_40184/m.93785 type:complete len:201 (-) Transcript_40184:1480-2082(-)